MKFASSFIILYCTTSVQGLFLEKPKDAIVVESETAVFRCQLSNSSFRIHWIVDETAANFKVIKDRGVTVVSINDSTSHLHIIGYKSNNNTRVQCAGRLFDVFRVIEYVPSDVVTLKIYSELSKSTENAYPVETETLQWQPKYTPFSSFSVRGTLVPHPSQNTKLQDSEWVIPVATTTCGVVFFLIMALIVLVSLCMICKQRGKVQNTKQQCVYYDTVLEKSDVNTFFNDAYQKTQHPIMPPGIHCQENPSYVSVVLGTS